MGKKFCIIGAVVVVKWSACSPSTPTIWVRIPLTSLIFFYKSLRLNRTKINKKEAVVGPFSKNVLHYRFYVELKIHLTCCSTYNDEKWFDAATYFVFYFNIFQCPPLPTFVEWITYCRYGKCLGALAYEGLTIVRKYSLTLCGEVSRYVWQPVWIQLL